MAPIYDSAVFWSSALFSKAPHRLRRVLGFVGLGLGLFWLFGLGVLLGAGRASGRVLAGALVWEAIGLLLVYQMPRRNAERDAA